MERKEMRALTINEQKIFLEAVNEATNYNQYAFVLQTGLSAGELIGLRWSDVDLKNRVIHIRRTMEYRLKQKNGQSVNLKLSMGKEIFL